MSRRPLPPLQVDTAYVAADFERFEYFGNRLTGEATATLRLHLKNGTTLDVPADDESLHFLMRVLMEAFPPVAKEHAAKWFRT